MLHVLATLATVAKKMAGTCRVVPCSCYILSGDDQATVAAVAQQVGIPLSCARGGLSPADKLDAVEGLKKLHGSTIMVGA